uniref:Phosphoinositide phospholipase C n=1 Tax=Arcella intermedia TaxID=1963864 RepID=A0A6B2KZP2_9EUKA
MKMLQSLKERSMNIDLPQLTQKFKADLSELINLLDIKLKDRSNFSLVKFNQTPIDTNKWCNFMIFVQGEKELSLETLKGQLKRYSSKFFHSTEENEYQWEATTKFTIRMFWNYLFDPIQNSIASPPKNEENLDGPLKDYWIDSSHNTYLPGDQLSSDTTTEMYRIALLRGCRCLELDVWSSDNELVVHHGFTITKKIPLADCLKTIRDYAFKVSDLPLILSFEFHISFDSKREVAKICETTFGDMLQTTDSYPYKGGVVSPQTLKRKILMKFHKNKRVVEDKDSHVSNGWKLFRKGDFSKAIQLATKNVPEEQVELDPIDEDDPLERFACIPGGLDAPHGVESAPEEKLSSLLRLANQKLIRIYPRATRTDSSNFNPISAWVNGYQMAAMNYQSDGFPMWLNDAKFSAKKYGGWIRKPDIIKKHSPKRLRITVISGWRLPAPWKSVDTVETHSLVQAGVLSLHKVEEVLPQVEVSLWDDLTPTVEQERLTNPPSTDILLYRTIICSDAFNPLFWKDGTGVHVSAGCFRPSSTPMDEGEPGPFEFEIKNEDFETIVFRVIDRNILSESQNDVIGYFAIRVADMRNGFRVVPLKGEMGTPLLHGSLLVYVEYPAPDVVELESQKTTRTKKKDMVISETTSLKKGDYILLEDND